MLGFGGLFCYRRVCHVRLVLIAWKNACKHQPLQTSAYIRADTGLLPCHDAGHVWGFGAYVHLDLYLVFTCSWHGWCFVCS